LPKAFTLLLNDGQHQLQLARFWRRSIPNACSGEYGWPKAGPSVRISKNREKRPSLPSSSTRFSYGHGDVSPSNTSVGPCGANRPICRNTGQRTKSHFQAGGIQWAPESIECCLVSGRDRDWSGPMNRSLILAQAASHKQPDGKSHPTSNH